MPERYQSRRRRRRRRSKWPIVLLAVVLVIGGAAGAVHLWVRPPELPRTEEEPAAQSAVSAQAQRDAAAAAAAAEEAARLERKPDFYTILVSGVDDGNGGSDTNILMAVDAGAGAIHCVSIPRDTKAIVSGKAHKINYAYNLGGSELLASTASEILGIPVDFTVSVGLNGFVALVNAVNGVDFDVPVNMDYDDPTQDLSIHFTKGMQHLNGLQAMEVVRFREGYASQDLGRMNTQQEFLKAVARQVLRPANLDKIPELAKIFQKYVDTDLSLGNLAWLGQVAFDAGAENITFTTLPGEWVTPYIYTDPEETLTLINESLNPYVKDRLPSDLNIPD